MLPRMPEGPQQHDLSPAVATRMVAGARIRPGEQVLDAGAGLGAISAALLEAGAQVTAVEFDPERIHALRRRFADHDRIHVISADLRRWRHAFEGPWRVVANPPFHLTAELVRAWVLGRDPPQALDLILQHEAAEKLSGRPGNHTRSSALLAVAGAATYVARLGRDATTPPSRVDLAVWRFRRDAQADDLDAVDALLERAFAGPRTVAEALRGLATPIQVRRQAAEHGYNPQAHPRTIHPAAWLPMARLLRMCGKL